MGCWNTTCYVSKLPIYYREPVVMILVRETHSYEDYHLAPHTFHATDKYVPFGYPIYGKYDDYGGIEDIENEDEILEYLNTVEVYKSRKKKVDITKKNLNDVLNKIAHEEYFTFDKLHLEALFVRRDLYHILIKEMSSRRIYGKNETIAHQMKRLLKKELDKLHEEISSNDDEYFTSWRVSRTTTGTIARISLIDMAWDISPYIKLKLFNKFNDDDMNRLTEIIMFRNVLDSLRMGYFCISGDGSQSCEMYLHTLVAKYILNYASKSFKEAQDDSNEKMDKREYLTGTCYGYYEPNET